MLLKVLEYDKFLHHFMTQDERGEKHRVDFFPDGGLSENYVNHPETLVGLTVYVDYLFPYLELTMGTRLAESVVPSVDPCVSTKSVPVTPDQEANE